MSAEKSTAIILRVTEFSETSCVVTMLTREFGKITAIAKGARRPKSPFESALDLLSLVRVVFLHKTSGAMDLLTEARLERRFRSASKSLPRLYAGFFVVELLRTLTEEKDPHPDLFDLAVDFIRGIDTEAPLTDLSLDRDATQSLEITNYLLYFEIGMLQMLGHFPLLTNCVGCGRPRLQETSVDFGLADGGLICQRCRPGKHDVITVSPDAIRALKRIANQLISQLTNQFQVTDQLVRESPNHLFDNDRPKFLRALDDNATPPSIVHEMQNLILGYLQRLAGFEPRVQKFLNQGQSLDSWVRPIRSRTNHY